MATREELQQRIIAAIDAHRDEIREVGEEIRLNPEIGYQEVKASKLLAGKIAPYGFEVEKPAGGVETAFVASRHGYKDGGHVAVLAEYDALPGIGHGCGHNLIAASGLAAAIGMAAVMDEVPGVFEVIGTPAEEGGGGKIQLADAGIFKDVDAALMVHHGGNSTDAASTYPEGRSLAVAHVDYEFFGKPAHAAGDPWNGNNAVNAVVALFNGIDALRQHIRMESRIHGIITHGGDAPNVVPNHASAKFYIRAETMDYMQELVDKVARIAEGAALMTGCQLKITEGETCFDMRPSYTVGGRYKEHMQAMGLEIKPRPIGRKASTDFGNISYLMPAVTGRFAISHEPIPGHSQQVVDASGSDYGYEQLIKVSKAMALTALDLLLDEQLLAQAKDEHANWSERFEGAAAK